ncbi:helix-turn-helix domain-containing protein [Brevundimonas sp.]|uniref:helix-turn-helix domain-containing protein n=1 Tax=Brevundimonas sp. TaxID=1871086 RepID=UPI00391A794C
MPLDAGVHPDVRHDEAEWSDPHRILTESATLGDALRRARDHSSRSIEDMSAATRVHVRYLRALEQGDFTALPSQAFALGYVRAYAAALGLDEQLAGERFKRESPHAPVGLQPPTGVDVREARRRSPRLIAAAAALVFAVIGWNVFQRVSLMQAPSPPAIAETPETWSLGSAPGVVRLGAPRAAPPDQTVPVLYITPGLEAELSGVDAEMAAGGEVAAAAPAAPVQRAFNPRGASYGASPTASNVVIQAQRPASIVVRMADNRVLFARQLAAGESWRAPRDVTAVIDVSEPSAFTVYLNGEYEGPLAAAVTPLAGLNARAQAAARQTAADLAQRTGPPPPAG